MTSLGHLERYYSHLYTLSGGTLTLRPSRIRLWGSEVFQVHLTMVWNGKPYASAVRMEVGKCLGGWGHQDHPLIYETAKALRELCYLLAHHGCDYAIMQT